MSKMHVNTVTIMIYKMFTEILIYKYVNQTTLFFSGFCDDLSRLPNNYIFYGTRKFRFETKGILIDSLTFPCKSIFLAIKTSLTLKLYLYVLKLCKGQGIDDYLKFRQQVISEITQFQQTGCIEHLVKQFDKMRVIQVLRVFTCVNKK